MSNTLDPDLRSVLESIVEWVGIVDELTSATSYSRFMTDRTPQLAISKAIEWIGELSGRVIRKWPAFQAGEAAIEFAEAYNMRNRLAHGYDKADLKTVWDTATVSIPAFGRAIQAVIDRADGLS